MANLCQAFHVLPRAGGIYDQDPYDVYRLRLVLQAQEEKAEKDRAEIKKKQKGR